MLIGGFLQNVDIKGRVFIPSRFRSDLGSRFYVHASFDGCVRAYSEKAWEEFMEKLSTLPIDANQIMRDICESAAAVDMDAQGRVVINEDLRRHSGIENQVKIIGMVGWVEFWEPGRAEKQKASIDREETLQRLAALGIR